MKFGKEVKSRMVPEWQEVYMDYNYLKTVLKDIQQFCPKKLSSSTPRVSTTVKKKASLYREFSGLTNRHGVRPATPRRDEEAEVIVVNSVKGDDDDDETRYQTLFLRTTDEGGEYELVFFRRLDEQFNKVVKFYKGKVDEVMNEADELSRQMNSLIALRIRVEKPNAIVSGRTDFGPSPNVSSRRTEMEIMDVIKEVDVVNEEGASVSKEKPPKVDRQGASIMGSRPTPLDILDHVKINVAPETPRSTVKGMLGTSTSQISFSKAELKKAEAIMTKAFVAFHHKLRILKSFSLLNQLAFSKILKKYDKITSRNASKAYMEMVDNSYLGNSDVIDRLIRRVEAAYIKYFAYGNREKGMHVLRPKSKSERHGVTFISGGLFGFALALIVAVIVTVHARDILEKPYPERQKYMENIFPLYSLFGFVVLHLIMYSGNIYFWMRYRINYPFIFGFKQGTELRYREVLLIASGLTVIMFVGVLSNLNMEMDISTGNYNSISELLPLLLLTIVLLITFCPFNFIYRSSRFFLITCVLHCIFAPFYKVTLPDFFLADQLTSQVQAFRNLEFYVCYYGWGDFLKRRNTCSSSKVYEGFYFLVAIIPYWMRFIQCLRRLFEEKDKMQGYNAIKYLSTIIALILRSLYDLKLLQFWRISAAICSALATIINTYWDLVVDWGLFQKNSENKWLRDKLVVQNNNVYYIAMVVNVILRLAWMQVILGWREAPFLHPKAVVTLMACLEIIRRGIWNFFRIENEHLNNVGKYRASKSVPLPFQHDEDT